MKPVLAFRHVAREPLGTIDGVLRSAELPFNYIDLSQDAPRFFDPRQLAGLVVLGGPMNVDEVDRYPFLKNEVRWIQAALETGLPTLGICLGAQLIAKALGARVWKAPKKEIGWYEVELLDGAEHDPLFRHLEKRQTVFQWHGDTFDLPAGATRLARSEICENQAFSHGNCAWAIQFHLEVTTDIIETWLTEPDGCVEIAALDYIDPAKIRAETPTSLPAMQAVGQRAFHEFAAICRKRAV